MDDTGLTTVLDALRRADQDIASAYEDAAQLAEEGTTRDSLLRLARQHRSEAADVGEQLRRVRRPQPGRAEPARVHVAWGTGGYGTGDQFGGGQAGGAGGFPSAGPSYSGGEDDLTTGE